MMLAEKGFKLAILARMGTDMTMGVVWSPMTTPNVKGIPMRKIIHGMDAFLVRLTIVSGRFEE